MSVSVGRHQANGICPCCKLPRDSTNVKYWDCSFDELKRAASSDCPRCSFVLNCVDWAVPRLFSDESIQKIRIWENYPCAIYLPDRSVNLDIFTLSGQKSTPLNITRTRSLLPGETSAEATFETIKGWIEQCISNHGRCRSIIRDGSVVSRYPKRILDLNNGLVILRENYRPQRYACLSHCWGLVTDIIRTTADTLDEFMVQIPWSRLTRTFQDAVDICRRLGIFFLWADSLCIIQDNDEDWKEQAAKMAGIYENAFITIAATKSKDSSLGCYSQTEPEFIASLVPGYQDVYIRQEPSKYPTHWGARDRSKAWPLLNRGWIYQEMRLSCRVLHFCSQEVMWECQTTRKSESGCSDQDLGRAESRYAWTRYEAVPYWKLAENPRLLWYRTVQEYSRLKLTFEKDKMPALAALTQHMESIRVDDRFLAGLWEKTLLLDLLWMVWLSLVCGRPSIRCAPTWSWASVQSQVMWDSALESTLSSVQLVDMHYITVGPSHMGDISEASITLRAPVIKAEYLFAAFRARRYQREDNLDPADGIAIPSFQQDNDQDLVKELSIHDYKYDCAAHLTREDDGPADSETFFILIGAAANDHHAGICVRRRQGDSSYERMGRVELVHRRANEIGRKELLDMDYRRRREFLGPLIRRVDFILESLPLSTITLV